MMDDLVEWLRAQLDEDERVARATTASSSGIWHITTGGEVRDSDGIGIIHTSARMVPAELEHIVRHDPARVLREVEAKRQIIDSWEASQDDNLPPLALIALDEVVKALALPFADRPGYQESWRP